MRLRKTVLLVASTALFVSLNTNSCMAKTATVSTETLNLRKEASTSSTVLELLDIGEKLEVLEEDGDWIKVKVNGITGYVNKSYVKVNDETTNTKNTETTKPETTNAETINTETANTKPQNTIPEKTEETENESVESIETIGNTSPQSQETPTTNASEEHNETLQTNLINQEVTVKVDSQVSILPLINASKISTIKKDEKVTIIDEVNGWCYIQTEQISGWARKAVLNIKQGEPTVPTSAQPVNNQEPTNTTGSNYEQTSEQVNEQISSTTTNEVTNTNLSQGTNESEIEIDETPVTEKTMYVNYSSVNVRKGPSTDYEAEDALILNDEVTVIAESGDWYKVKAGSITGYIAKRLLSDTMQSTSRSAEERALEQGLNENETQDTENNEQTTTQSEQQVVATSSKGQEIVEFAKQYLGCKYVYGGSGPSTFDCSGFTMYVFKNFGVSLSHSATAQSKNGTYVAKSDLQPGDLVFFKDYETMVGIGHCGIYIGDGNFIHASSGTGYCVKISTLLTGSYNTRYETARRIF